jgi:hypothetical protein
MQVFTLVSCFFAGRDGFGRLLRLSCEGAGKRPPPDAFRDKEQNR